MLWMIRDSILLELLVILGVVYYVTPIKKITVRQWFFILIAGAIADTASTFLAAYLWCGGDWSREINPYVQAWGPHIGFIAATLLHEILLVLLVFIPLLAPCWLFGKMHGLCYVYFILALLKFYAAMHNILLPIVNF